MPLPTAPYSQPNITSIVDIFSYGNTVTGSYLGLTILFIIFVVMFVALKAYPTEKALASASFTTAIISYLLSALSIVPPYAVAITTIVVMASLFMLWRSGTASV